MNMHVSAQGGKNPSTTCRLCITHKVKYGTLRVGGKDRLAVSVLEGIHNIYLRE